MGVDPYRKGDDDTDEAGLPEHEQDESRRRTGSQQAEPNPAEDAGLPEYEQDTRGGQDTGTQQPNP